MTNDITNAGADTNPRLSERVAKDLLALGLDSAYVKNGLSGAPPDTLELLAAVAQKIPASAMNVKAEESKTLAEYRDTVLRIGADYYVGAATYSQLSSGETDPDSLRIAVDYLAETAKLLRAAPTSLRTNRSHVLMAEIADAKTHCAMVVRAMTVTGVADALDAEHHVVMRNLRRDAIPDLDLEVLRRAGNQDPESALVDLVRVARSAPQYELTAKTVAAVLDEAMELMPKPQDATAQRTKQPPKPKRWAGWGKILTGLAVAGGNVLGGVVSSFAAVTVDQVITSCGAGVGSVCEGVGALRGE